MRYLEEMPVKTPSLAGGRKRARLAVQRALHDKRIASLDEILGRGETSRFLALHQLWPTEEQEQLIERRLGWPYGTIEAIVRRPPVASLDGPGQALVTLAADMTEGERTALLELVRVTRIRAQFSEADAIKGELAQ